MNMQYKYQVVIYDTSRLFYSFNLNAIKFYPNQYCLAILILIILNSENLRKNSKKEEDKLLLIFFSL